VIDDDDDDDDDDAVPEATCSVSVDPGQSFNNVK